MEKQIIGLVWRLSKEEALELVILLMNRFGITAQDFINENRRLRKEANRYDGVERG